MGCMEMAFNILIHCSMPTLIYLWNTIIHPAQVLFCFIIIIQPAQVFANTELDICRKELHHHISGKQCPHHNCHHNHQYYHRHDCQLREELFTLWCIALHWWCATAICECCIAPKAKTVINQETQQLSLNSTQATMIMIWRTAPMNPGVLVILVILVIITRDAIVAITPL